MKSRAPLVLEDVQADAPQFVNVRVVNPGDEPHLHNSHVGDPFGRELLLNFKDTGNPSKNGFNPN